MDLSSAKSTASPDSPEYTWVATPDAFHRLLEALVPESAIAVDVEADSLYHYFDKVCLIQISTELKTFILDPLVLRDLRALAPIMAHRATEKVFHAASYDVSCLRRDFGFSFAHIFDTHLAAQLLGYERLGLDALLEKLLGVIHSKRRQRDDWSRRPLDSEQLRYAAMDTHHLLQLKEILQGQLREKGRLSWAQEEFEAAENLNQQVRVLDPQGFLRIKGSRNLSLQEQAVLQALYLLRDRYARKMDLPPYKVLRNSVLLDLARRSPSSPQALGKHSGIPYRIARNCAEEIFQTAEAARAQDPSFLLKGLRNTWKPPSREVRTRLERLKSWRHSKSLELRLPAGVVFPRNLLELLAASPPADQAALEELQGIRRWRCREFGAEILQILGIS